MTSLDHYRIRAHDAEDALERVQKELGEYRSRCGRYEANMVKANTEAEAAEARERRIREAVEATAKNYEAAAEMESLPEGDLGWRYNTRATAETLRAMLPGDPELPGLDDAPSAK